MCVYAGAHVRACVRACMHMYIHTLYVTIHTHVSMHAHVCEQLDSIKWLNLTERGYRE